MNAAGIIGVVLIILGIAALAIGGFSYTREEQVLDVGPIEASVEEERDVPIPPIAGVAAIAAGVVLVAVGRRKKSA